MSLVKKSVVIEGHKNRQKGITSRGKKGFKQLDEKSRHEIKKVIQQSRNNGESVLDLSDRNIFSPEIGLHDGTTPGAQPLTI